jgi:hypothetical protein
MTVLARHGYVIRTRILLTVSSSSNRTPTGPSSGMKVPASTSEPVDRSGAAAPDRLQASLRLSPDFYWGERSLPRYQIRLVKIVIGRRYVFSIGAEVIQYFDRRMTCIVVVSLIQWIIVILTHLPLALFANIADILPFRTVHIGLSLLAISPKLMFLSSSLGSIRYPPLPQLLTRC